MLDYYITFLLLFITITVLLYFKQSHTIYKPNLDHLYDELNRLKKPEDKKYLRPLLEEPITEVLATTHQSKALYFTPKSKTLDPVERSDSYEM